MTEKDYREYCMKEAKRLGWFDIKEDGEKIILIYDIAKSIMFTQWITVSIWIDGWKAGFDVGRDVGHTEN